MKYESDRDLAKFTAGFHGGDSMRDKAQKIMNDEFSKVSMHVPHSASQPKKEKMRLYAKGGHVKPSTASDMAAAKSARSASSNFPKIIKSDPLTRKDMAGTKAGNKLDVTRGPRPGSNPKTPGLSVQSEKQLAAFAKGGAVEREIPKPDAGFKKGGALKRAAGGPIHSDQAMSWRKDTLPIPSQGGPREKNVTTGMNKSDASSGTVFKKGGKVQKFAAGGAAKVRHEVSDTQGKVVCRKKIVKGK